MKTPMITLTGIDEKTDPDWVAKTYERHGRWYDTSTVEFAILRSAKNAGNSPRYPSEATIRRLVQAAPKEAFAFHLCGRYARMVHEERWAELCGVIDFSRVGRVQVNADQDDDAAILRLWRFSCYIGKPVIMQWRGDTFPSVPDNLQLLQDRSGGRGKQETVWSVPDDLCVKARSSIGYAGGITPDNIFDAVPFINSAAKGLRYWIDAESGLRTDDWFDQVKADRMIERLKIGFEKLYRSGLR